MIEICLGRKSQNINVQSMLASLSEKEAEMLPRRPAGPEMPDGGHGGRSAASAVKMPRRAASGGVGDGRCRKRRQQGGAGLI